ncbi:hypothetical protein Cylst_3283 [Cylindrospermum stagnale PCC 7417]|uniref:Uncharacterized protein n=1 Tax=Cylindrospermum stagnale PCC 7417 TaxID=56107 RepID=K9WYZ6_9NOST|nr:hypothetical protein [Cylindrospermum stagnale]AFZ25438.1 hypothetical protein Cylst_3283 [Cylindrospermum stagnale PCC 7417]
MPSESITLTAVQLDLVNSTESIKVIHSHLGNRGLRLFIEDIEKVVSEAFNESVSSLKIDSKFTRITENNIKEVIDAEMPPTNLSEKPNFNRITEAMADGYRLTFESVEYAYSFVKEFCDLVKKGNEKPGTYKWVFRIGAATDDIDYDTSSINPMVGMGFATVKELETGAYPGWIFVDRATYDTLSEEIKHNFSQKEFTTKHQEVKQAWGCQMISDASLPTAEPITLEEIYALFKKLTQSAQITRVAQLIGMPNDFRPSTYVNLFAAKTAIVDWAAGYENGDHFRLERLNGSSILKIAVRRIASTSMRASGTTSTVFELRVLLHSL